jgi:predicted amidohydrolase YtcJ
VNGGAADLLIRGARVFGAVRPDAAVAVRGGRIAAVGSARELDALQGPATRILELPGRLLLPGFQDAHMHPAWSALERRGCDLRELPPDQAGYLAAVRAHAAAEREQPWLLGFGWRQPAFVDGLPERAALDALELGRPLLLRSQSTHEAWVDSRALRLAGITRETPDPPGGRIVRDADGEPTGALLEHAVELVASLVPAPTRAELSAALRDAQEQLLALGVTGFQDAKVEVGGELLAAYVELARSDALRCRAALALAWEPGEQQPSAVLDALLAARESAHVGRLSAPTAKIFQDGIVSSRTAALIEPYRELDGRSGDERGESLVAPELLREHATLLDAAGVDVHVHAVGDRAAREALDAFAAARGANGPRDSRHQIAHLELVDPDDLPRFAALGVIANLQPYWARRNPYIRDLHVPFFGAERAGRIYPFGSLHRAGAALAVGTDWPIDLPDPLRGIEVATTRVGPDDRAAPALIPEQALPLSVVLAAATAGSARACRHEPRRARSRPARRPACDRRRDGAADARRGRDSAPGSDVLRIGQSWPTPATQMEQATYNYGGIGL